MSHYLGGSDTPLVCMNLDYIAGVCGRVCCSLCCSYRTYICHAAVLSGPCAVLCEVVLPPHMLVEIQERKLSLSKALWTMRCTPARISVPFLPASGIPVGPTRNLHAGPR